MKTITCTRCSYELPSWQFNSEDPDLYYRDDTKQWGPMCGMCAILEDSIPDQDRYETEQEHYDRELDNAFSSYLRMRE